MTLDQIVVIVAGLALIAFVYWFFLKRKPTESQALDNKVEITVQGGYKPEVVRVQLGKPVTLTFLRTDPSGCLEEVVLPDFKVRKQLPLNERVTISITPEKAGTHQFTCGMNMFHGKLIVE